MSNQKIAFLKSYYQGVEGQDIKIECERVGTPEQIAEPLDDINVRIVYMTRYEDMGKGTEDFEDYKLPLKFAAGSTTASVIAKPTVDDVSEEMELCGVYFKTKRKDVTKTYGRSRSVLLISDAPVEIEMPEEVEPDAPTAEETPVVEEPVTPSVIELTSAADAASLADGTYEFKVGDYTFSSVVKGGYIGILSVTEAMPAGALPSTLNLSTDTNATLTAEVIAALKPSKLQFFDQNSGEVADTDQADLVEQVANFKPLNLFVDNQIKATKWEGDNSLAEILTYTPVKGMFGVGGREAVVLSQLTAVGKGGLDNFVYMRTAKAPTIGIAPYLGENNRQDIGKGNYVLFVG